MGLTQRDVTSSMLISLSGNNQVAPSFWLNPANGISYNVGVQTSQYRLDSLDRAAADAGHVGVERGHRDHRRVAGGRVRCAVDRVVAERRVAGLRQPGSDDRRVGAAAVEPGRRQAQLRPGHHQPLQRRAGVRRVRERRSPRPGQRRRGGREDRPEGAGEPAARHHADAARRVRRRCGRRLSAWGWASSSPSCSSTC